MRKRILFLPLLLAAMGIMAAESLKVTPLNGSDRVYAIQRIGKILFDNDIMYLYDFGGTLLGQTPVADIDKIAFTDEADNSAVLNISRSSITVYPNPAQDIIELSGLEGQNIVRIYTLQGQMLKLFNVTDDKVTLDVSGLDTGCYLLQTGAQVLRIIKE